LKITIVTGFFLPVPAIRGGATEKIWLGLAETFAASGHSVTFVSRRWPGVPDDEVRDGITHRRVAGFDHSRYLALNLLLDFFWGLRVSRKLPPADATICNTVAMPVWLKFMRPSAGAVCVMIGRRPKGQVPLYRAVDRIYVPSSSVAAEIRSASASRRTRVTGYPIDWSTHALASRQTANPVTIGYVGRLHPEKGIAVFLAAIKRLAVEDLPEWRVKIVGPSSVAEGGGGEDWVDSLKRDTAIFAGDRVEWLGPEFDPGRLASVYGGMDIFCYPSLADRGETFGVAVAEAMASRCAVVVSALDCFGDLVSDGDTGLVFNHGDSAPEKPLSECLARLISDGDFRRGVAARGQERAKLFDYPEVSRHILDDLAFLTGAGGEKPQSSSHAE
jgi:glycosyltransferase involved in cell wall biosynthesis